MKLCRYRNNQDQIHLGLTLDDASLWDLGAAGENGLTDLLEREDLAPHLAAATKDNPPKLCVSEARLLAPVEHQEVWAAGVTYLRSKTARMEESGFSASAYDRIYEAERPELFFKSLAHKVAGPGAPVGIRRDARWNVPEPELALVINSRGSIVAYTLGNDMSARDIEGENLLYLPQAKIYTHSCALGPWLRVGTSEAEARTWKIRLAIQRGGQEAFAGETSIGQIKRSFTELTEFLWRSQAFANGAVLLTGTGIVPPDHFTLQPGDRVRISVPEIGTLENPVVLV